MKEVTTKKRQIKGQSHNNGSTWFSKEVPTSTVVQSVLFLYILKSKYREYNLSFAPDLGFNLYMYVLE